MTISQLASTAPGATPFCLYLPGEAANRCFSEEQRKHKIATIANSVITSFMVRSNKVATRMIGKTMENVDILTYNILAQGYTTLRLKNSFFLLDQFNNILIV